MTFAVWDTLSAATAGMHPAFGVFLFSALLWSAWNVYHRRCCECDGHLEYAGVENNHDQAGDVEWAKRGVDDELRVVETTEVYLYQDDLMEVIIATLMMVDDDNKDYEIVRNGETFQARRKS